MRLRFGVVSGSARSDLIGTLPLVLGLDCEAAGGSVSNSGLRDGLLFREFAGTNGGGAVLSTFRDSAGGGDEGRTTVGAAVVSTEEEVLGRLLGGGVLASSAPRSVGRER